MEEEADTLDHRVQQEKVGKPPLLIIAINLCAVL